MVRVFRRIIALYGSLCFLVYVHLNTSKHEKQTGVHLRILSPIYCIFILYILKSNLL